jgi:hypothetical protein
MRKRACGRRGGGPQWKRERYQYMERDRIEVGPLQGHQWVTGMMLRSVWARRDGTNGLEAVQTSETSVYCSETTWRYIP